MKGRILPLITLLAGVATLVVFVMLGRQPDVAALYQANEVSGVVSDFQRAATMDDLVGVFGDPPNPAAIAAMDALNTLDLQAFIAAYVIFLCAAAVMLGGLRSPFVWAAIAFAMAGGVFDAIETWNQLQITADYANAETYLPIATWHWLKYAALAGNGLAVAALLVLGERKNVILAAIALAPLPLVALAYADVVSTRFFAGAFGLYWIALLIAAAIAMVRGRGAPA
ncbi:MAG: hypothetical protein AB7Q23_06685 [Hyphomonadaceae bacterium]